jgi:hypothetical protein
MEPHQQSNEESKQQEQGAQENTGQSSSPSYEYFEFPPDASPSKYVARGPLANEPTSEPSEQDIQQGLVYPPPPSYYQNMQISTERPPLPGKPLQPSQQPLYTQQLPYAPSAYYGYGRPGMPAPTYAPGQYPGVMPPYSPVRRSRKHIWIIVSIISASVLLLCGAGGWAFYSIFTAVSQQVNGATQLVQDFYQHLQTHDENNAYFDLQIDGLTSNAFFLRVQGVVSQYGSLTSFKLDSTSFSSNAGLSRWQITEDVTRQYASYTVPVSVDSINGGWKITAIDLSKF